ncbi:MAG: tetratricopeptide repeat protein [Vicinamibacterales bacterium]
MMPPASRVYPWLLAGAMVMTIACGPNDGASVEPRLIATPFPALTGADPDAQRQLRDAYTAFTAATANRGATPGALSAAYGDMGRLFMAAELYEAAEPCLLNALALSPRDARWSYFLAHLYRRTGALTKSAAYFEHTLTIQPTNVPALWWLATVYLAQGRPADAEVRFSQALALQPGALSAVFGLGRAALARNDYAKAVEYLERVLAMNERAIAAHYPLGLAYRGLGQLDRAETHLAQRGHMEILPIDPLMNALDTLLQSVTAYQDRGMRAGLSGNWEEAAAQFRRAVELAPDNIEARLDLGHALLRTGDAAGAAAEAREAVRLAPNDPRAQSLARSLSATIP